MQETDAEGPCRMECREGFVQGSEQHNLQYKKIQLTVLVKQASGMSLTPEQPEFDIAVTTVLGAIASR